MSTQEERNAEIEAKVMKKVEAMMPMLKLAARGKQAGVEYRFDAEGNFIELEIPGLKEEELS
jgi:hypothetical protein